MLPQVYWLVAQHSPRVVKAGRACSFHVAWAGIRSKDRLVGQDSGALATAPDNQAMCCCIDELGLIPSHTSGQHHQQAHGCMRQAFDEVAARTSTLPFQAIWEGRQVMPLAACPLTLVARQSLSPLGHS